MSVILYGYNLGDFVKDFYELSMILISYELELNEGEQFAQILDRYVPWQNQKVDP